MLRRAASGTLSAWPAQGSLRTPAAERSRHHGLPRDRDDRAGGPLPGRLPGRPLAPPQHLGPLPLAPAVRPGPEGAASHPSLTPHPVDPTTTTLLVAPLPAPPAHPAP